MPNRKENGMKPQHHTTGDDARPSLQEIGSWPLALIHLHQRLAPYFARSEPRQHALLYLQAIISEIPRKNSWQIAEHAKQARPYGMQRLLSRAVWDEEGFPNELRAHPLQCLNPPPKHPRVPHPPPHPVHVIDESGFPKPATPS